MKEVLIITGPCGIGKTTLAKAWANSKKGAIIECDYFTEWIFDPGFPHWTMEEEKLTTEITAKVANEYLLYGMSVAIDNVWSPTGINIIRKRLSQWQDVTVKAVRLVCKSDENHRRDNERIPEDQMKERVDIVAHELDVYEWPDWIQTIDTTDLTVPQMVSLIEKLDAQS